MRAGLPDSAGQRGAGRGFRGLQAPDQRRAHHWSHVLVSRYDILSFLSCGSNLDTMWTKWSCWRRDPNCVFASDTKTRHPFFLLVRTSTKNVVILMEQPRD